MKILFLFFHGFSDVSGISKKIISQIDGLRQCGCEVDICQYKMLDNGDRVRLINDSVIQNYGVGKLAAIRRRINYNELIKYCYDHKYDIIYVRSYHNANPFTINLFKKLRRDGAKIAFEIPTYPYDQEYNGFPLKSRMNLLIDRIFRKKLASYTNAIVTFTEDKLIFGKRTIRISNGVDFNNISLQDKKSGRDDVINLVGVAEVHYWHGFDRIIWGLGEYYKRHNKSIRIIFHIVGGVGPSEMYDSRHARGFHELIEEYQLKDNVVFHGQLFGQQLDDVMNIADFAVGSLARHRCGIHDMKSLKNREYAARGIPFIYSESDSDFDDKEYVIKASADNTPINIDRIITFIRNNRFSASEIRNSIKHLSWEEQMRKVLEQL